MKRFLIFTCVWCALIACDSRNEGTEDGKLLVWSDEFDYSGAPDEQKWNYDVGDGCPTLCGWGNDELQYYTKDSDNVRVEDGHLIIEARKEKADTTKQFTSARLISKNKGDWKYGYVEVRAKLPKGTGTWAAIWMLPTEWDYGNWPRSGEIDIMEHVGYDHGTVHGTVHTENYNHIKGTQKGDSIQIDSVSDQFHNYAINWTPAKIEFIVDDKVYHTFNNDGTGPGSWPFDKDFHVILNVAVGGNWGGKKGVDPEIWPQKMIVDYVKIYRQDNPGFE